MSKRGFANMDPELRRQIASKGGKRSHELGTAHKFTSEKAREAGCKGGKAFHARRGPQPPAVEPVVSNEGTTEVVAE